MEVQRTLDKDEIEDYVSFIFALGLSNENGMEKQIYGKLQEMLTNYHSSLACAPILRELLRFFVVGSFSEEFSVHATDIFLKESKNINSNTAYMLYNSLNKTSVDFWKNCPKFAEKLDCSDYLEAASVLASYLVNSNEDVDSYDYISVARIFWKHIKNRLSHDLVSEDMNQIRIYKEALKKLHEGTETCEDEYKWLTQSEIKDMWSRLEADKAFIMEIEAKEAFIERKWERYGLFLYLKFLLTSLLEPVPEKEWFFSLSDDRPIERISPIIKINGKIYSDIRYIKLLNSFLTNIDKVHERESEIEIQNRVAMDLLYVVSMVFESDAKRCVRIKNMIFEYCQAIGVT